MEIQRGSTVSLKSNLYVPDEPLRPMTVETIGPMPLSESLAVRCVWFDNNGTIQKDTFWVEELVHVYDPNGNFVAPEI